MSDETHSKLELLAISPQVLVQRIDQHLGLVERLLAEAEAANALALSSFTNNLGMKMMLCPPGEFLMGSPEDEEGHDDSEKLVLVRISRHFWLAQTAVTREQWQALMGNYSSEFNGNKHLPVEQVSWNDAEDFCEKLNTMTTLPSGYRYALPTEAEWEYACRAGTATPFHFGSTLNGKKANCDGSYPYGTKEQGPNLGQTTMVGNYTPNTWGLHDMHGNVWEWCADWYGDRLPGGIDPSGPATGFTRVNRGGSWLSDAAICRAAYRHDFEPDCRIPGLGFRPALVPSR